MEQPLSQCWSTNSVPRAFFPRVAIGCRLLLKIDRNLSPSWAGGSVATWYDTTWIGGTVSGEYLYRSVVAPRWRRQMTRVSRLHSRWLHWFASQQIWSICLIQAALEMGRNDPQRRSAYFWFRWRCIPPPGFPSKPVSITSPTRCISEILVTTQVTFQRVSIYWARYCWKPFCPSVCLTVIHAPTRFKISKYTLHHRALIADVSSFLASNFVVLRSVV